jgi:hypothetical protein
MSKQKFSHCKINLVGCQGHSNILYTCHICLTAGALYFWQGLLNSVKV